MILRKENVYENVNTTFLPTLILCKTKKKGLWKRQTKVDYCFEPATKMLVCGPPYNLTAAAAQVQTRKSQQSPRRPFLRIRRPPRQRPQRAPRLLMTFSKRFRSVFKTQVGIAASIQLKHYLAASAKFDAQRKISSEKEDYGQ